MKPILLSNINMQPLVRALQPWEALVGTHNSMLADLSTTQSPASAADVTHVLCLYDSDTLMGEAFYGGAPRRAVRDVSAGARRLLRPAHRQGRGCQFIFVQFEPLARLRRCFACGLLCAYGKPT